MWGYHETTKREGTVLLNKNKIKKIWSLFPHPARMLLVFVAGVTILGVGAVLLVLPGPGIPLILIGLIILASEYAWAERILHNTKKASNGFSARLRKKLNKKTATKEDEKNSEKPRK